MNRSMSDWARRCVLITAAAGIWLGATPMVFALETVTKCDWAFLKQYKQLFNGEVIESKGQPPVLKVEGKRGVTMLPITTLRKPPVTKRFYVVHGRVKYEGVGGAGFLEMWSDLGDEKRFFSRTVEAAGPMRALSGSSGWREFCLPASLLTDASLPLPVALELNVHLPEGGTVWLSELYLSQSDEFEIPGPRGAWWNDRTGGLVGGIGGASLGILAGLAGWLGMRRKTLAAAVILFRLVIAASGVTLLAAVYGLVTGQPLCVVFPLGLLGTLGVAVPWSRLRQAEQQLAVKELRQVTAMDVA